MTVCLQAALPDDVVLWCVRNSFANIVQVGEYQGAYKVTL